MGTRVCATWWHMAMIGLISDSHGEWARTRQAMKLFHQRGCERIIHLGDIETYEVLDELAGYPVSLVFGNCDSVLRLHDYAVDKGLDVQHPAGTITVAGKQIGFLHGHDEKQYRQFLQDSEIDIVLHGHTHETRDEMVNTTRCINPGALHRAARYTVAVLDTEKDALEFLDLEAY